MTYSLSTFICVTGISVVVVVVVIIELPQAPDDDPQKR